MANYGNQQGGGPPQYGQPTGGARDAAFANIFGASPAMAGRSQTMTSQSHMRVPDRAATMSSQTADMMQRMPPMRQPVNGYDRRPPAPYDQRAQSSYDPQRPQSHDQPPQNYQRPMQPPNGYPPDPRFAQGVPQQRQPQPQYLPQPLRPLLGMGRDQNEIRVERLHGIVHRVQGPMIRKIAGAWHVPEKVLVQDYALAKA